jgi:DNA-binding GntR family transcriptional regulator
MLRREILELRLMPGTVLDDAAVVRKLGAAAGRWARAGRW